MGYPTGVVNIPTRVDGPTSTIFAEHVNILGDEIEAIEAALLASGSNGLQHSFHIKGPHPWADVRAFGAKGDGVTDDAVAIQAAIDLLTSGGIVYCPVGTYLFGAKLNMRSNVSLLGAGVGTVLKQKANTNLAHLLDFEVNSPVDAGVERLVLDGNQANQTSGTSLAVIGGTATRIAIRRCKLLDSKGNGLFLTGSALQCWIEENIFAGTFGNMAIRIQYAAQTSGRHVIRGNRIPILGNAFGIGLILADDNLIVSNDLRGDGTGNTNEAVNLDRSSRNRVISNDCSRRGDSGIVVHTGGQASPQSALNIIALNVCERNGQWGIALNEASAHNLVFGNIVRNNVQGVVPANQDAQIKLDSTSGSFPTVFNQINGNIIVDDQGVPTTARGILVVNTNVQDTQIGFNTIRGVTFPIADAGLRTVWVDLQTANLAFVASSLMISASGAPIRKILQANVTYDPPNLGDGAVAATTVTVTGANPGDVASASHDQIGVQNVQVSAHVQGANTVRVVLRNVSGAPLDIISGILRVVVTVI